MKNHKTCRARDIPFDDPLPVILAEHVRLYPSAAVTLPWHNPRDKHRHGKPVTRDLLFTHDGGHVNPSAFNWWWRKAWKAAGVPDRGPRLNGCHVLRHTAASAWLSNGLNIAKVAALLGDTKEVVLRTYAHFTPEDDDQARVIMKAFFSPEPGAVGAPFTSARRKIRCASRHHAASSSPRWPWPPRC